MSQIPVLGSRMKEDIFQYDYALGNASSLLDRSSEIAEP